MVSRAPRPAHPFGGDQPVESRPPARWRWPTAAASAAAQGRWEDRLLVE